MSTEPDQQGTAQQSSAAPSGAGRAEDDPNQLRICPGCGSLVKLMALKCRFCGTVLPGSEPLPEVVRQVALTLQQADELEREGRFPHEEAAGEGGLFRRRTWATLNGLMVTMGIAVHRVLTNPPPDRVDGWVSLLGTMSLILLVMLIGYAVEDLFVPRDSRRDDPQRALKAFLLSLRLGRPRYAYSILLPRERISDRFRSRVALASVSIRGGAFQTNTYAGFKRLWLPMVRGNWAFERKLRRLTLECAYVDDRYAIVTARYLLSGNPAAAIMPTLGLFAKRVPIELHKLMRRVGDKWYVVTADIASGADLLPKLYPEGMDRLERGEMPSEAVLQKALQQNA